MICSWIFKLVHASIAQSIMHLDRAQAVWEDLQRRFAQCDAQKIAILQNEIFNLKQGSLSVNDYYTRCRTLWEQMNTLRPLPVCKCVPRCSCDLVDGVRKERETDQIIRFLQGLNDDFNNLKSNVLVLDPLPEVYKVFVMAEKVERQNALANLTLGNNEVSQANAVQSEHAPNEYDMVAAMNSSYNSRRTSNSNKGAKCTYCGMSGHTVDKYFKKHEYPPGWIPGFKAKGKQTATTSSSSTVLEPVLSETTSAQLGKLISLLQTHIAKSPSANTTAAVSLIPKFEQDNSADEGCPWEDSWFG